MKFRLLVLFAWGLLLAIACTFIGLAVSLLP